MADSLSMKHSKQDAQYSKGMDKARCDICVHFLPPDGCEVVAGKIAPDMWCRHFERR